MDNEASTHESRGTGANKEAILSWEQTQKKKKKMPIFHPERGILKVPPGAQASNLVASRG